MGLRRHPKQDGQLCTVIWYDISYGAWNFFGLKQVEHSEFLTFSVDMQVVISLDLPPYRIRV